MKNREKALAKNTFIIAVGNFLPKLTTLITLPILTAYLTKTEYGTFDFISTLVSLVLPIATLKIEAAAFRFLIACRDDREETKTVISNIYAFLVPISFAVVVALFFIYNQLAVLTRVLLCLYFFFDIFFSATQQIIRGLSRNFLYSVGAILYSVVNMLMIVLTVAKLQRGLDGVLISMLVALIAALIVLFASAGLIKLFSFSSISKKKLKEMLAYSWPMVPNSLSSWVINMSDRLIVTAILGVEVNAVYAVANKIPNLFATLNGTFTFAWQENASISVKDDDVSDYYSGVFDSIYTLLVGAMACLIAVTPILFRFLINEQYAEAYYQMPFLFGGMLCSAMASFMGGIYVAHMRTKSVGITTIAAAISNVAINFLLINKIGLYAASISTFVSYLFLMVYRMIDVQKFQKIKYNYLKIFVSFIVLIIFAAICYLNNFYLNILNFILCFVFAAIICRKMLTRIIKELLIKLKKKINQK